MAPWARHPMPDRLTRFARATSAVLSAVRRPPATMSSRSLAGAITTHSGGMAAGRTAIMGRAHACRFARAYRILACVACHSSQIAAIYSERRPPLSTEFAPHCTGGTRLSLPAEPACGRRHRARPGAISSTAMLQADAVSPDQLHGAHPDADVANRQGDVLAPSSGTKP